ncbi:MAG: hypothetical protein F6K18_25925 [Okeania sp. SIO2C2]|uniref:hypothetical protein n=1 Tax=Okeania sp. SIO2C2 TaxID=2607787 RepID=UPI0013BD7743|nr:hypothetical protein [Okeania sp. SIO2C2]NEP89983.1 hypothetical protein [Okeania sp. SIO2C2]
MGILPVPDIFTPWQDTHPTYRTPDRIFININLARRQETGDRRQEVRCEEK